MKVCARKSELVGEKAFDCDKPYAEIHCAVDTTDPGAVSQLMYNKYILCVYIFSGIGHMPLPREKKPPHILDCLLFMLLAIILLYSMRLQRKFVLKTLEKELSLILAIQTLLFMQLTINLCLTDPALDLAVKKYQNY